VRLVCKILFLVFILPFNIFSAEGSLIENAVVIVGNNRAAGWVKESIAKIVGQREADFTYTTKFPGSRVVSVDIVPCTIQGVEHVQDDFSTTAGFALNSQEVVILEWFPPSIDTLKDNPMTKAIAKAFQILKPGGTLIIDNHPFFALCLDTKEKYEELKKLYPFSLVLDIEELVKIYNAVSGNFGESVAGSFFCSAFTKALQTSVAIFSPEISPKTDEYYEAINDTATHICKLFGDFHSYFEPSIPPHIGELVENTLKDIFKDQKGYMFLWTYHTLSRFSLIGSLLKEIGFDVTEAEFRITQVNPLNNRKWASIIQVKKSL